MAAHDYSFLTTWRVTGTCEEVYAILSDALALPRWWPDVYLSAIEVRPAGRHGAGGIVDLHTRGWLPYTLRWRAENTVIRWPHGFALAATGDFVGHGAWTFVQEGAEVGIRFEWVLRAEKPLLRALSWLLKPAFAANHRWAMARGEESLRRELVRRRDVPVSSPR